MTTIIKVENISRKIKDKVIFQNISFNVEKGQCVGLVGHNGSGKTMIMKAVCGFIPIDAGEIYVNNHKIISGKEFIKNAGILIESPSFFNYLSGLRNLEILANIQQKITSEQISHTLEQVGLLEAQSKKVNTYSLGMKQKLRIAQALMENPEILILDEPFNGLDRQSIQQLQTLLKEFQSKGATILLTTHDDRLISALCDTVYELESGQFI
ncbi:MAG: ABC transporter ATP-binding protein [Lysinibacillus sp.]